MEKVGGPDGFRAGFMKGTRESSGGGSMQARAMPHSRQMILKTIKNNRKSFEKSLSVVGRPEVGFWWRTLAVMMVFV